MKTKPHFDMKQCSCNYVRTLKPNLILLSQFQAAEPVAVMNLNACHV